MLNSKVLVLNRSYLPVQVTTLRRALGLLYKGAARAVDDDFRLLDFEQWCRLPRRDGRPTLGTVRGAILVPEVILLPGCDRLPINEVRFTRTNVFARDGFTCQYCGRRLHRSQLTLDHVIPRSMGGAHVWENVVTCCRACNKRKGDRTPEEAGMRLLRPPRRPRTSLHLHLLSERRLAWAPFLGG